MPSSSSGFPSFNIFSTSVSSSLKKERFSDFSFKRIAATKTIFAGILKSRSFADFTNFRKPAVILTRSTFHGSMFSTETM